MFKKTFFSWSSLAFLVLSQGLVFAEIRSKNALSQDEDTEVQILISSFIADLGSKDYRFGSLPLTENEKQALLKIMADQNNFPPNVKKLAFTTLCSFSPKIEPHFICYCKPEEINLVTEVPASLYGEIVKSMTISCVDVFVYNFDRRAYLLIQRATPPVKGKWWMPGGRVFKGESFYESAIRKTKKESGLNICPIDQLGTYSTYFSESAWGADVHTDTKNTVILALCDEQDARLDEHHQDLTWVSIDEPPDDPYILNAYKEAKTKLIQMGFAD
jgi:colanic acid biosynthesis protein WcaH